ncbi:hypothetical protein Bca4012_007579 [Brassica carinata]
MLSGRHWYTCLMNAKSHMINIILVSNSLNLGSLILELLITRQDHIGAGRERKGMYVFRGVETIGAVQQTSGLTIDDWHRRLGHLSSKALIC